MKDRKRFVYVSDILTRQGVPLDSNEDLKEVIVGNVYYDDLPVNETAELMKGDLFTDQADLVAEYGDEDLRCEVLEGEYCKLKQCPMFLPLGALTPMENRYKQPLCGEFRFVFEKSPKRRPDNMRLSEIRRELIS